MDKEIRDQKQAAWITLVTGILILAIKFYAYFLTNSQAVFSDALESIINVVTAITLLMVIYIATKPADRDHPYGHGKIEFFSAAFEGGLIAFASILIVWEALKSIWIGTKIQSLDQGALVLAGAGALNLFLGIYLKSLGKKRNSLALQASGHHVTTDFITSAGVIVAVLLAHWTGLHWIDSAMAVVIALHLTVSGMKLVLAAAKGLMDAEDRSIMEQILVLFRQNLRPGIIRIHHTRVIRSGQYHHIDAHVVVPEFWEVDRAHEETDAFENAVLSKYNVKGEIHFHLDPCRKAYCRVCDYPQCPVRRENFLARIPMTLEELQSPVEAEEFLRRRG